MALYKLSVYIHILSAIFWLGGMLFTIMVVVPTTRDSALQPKRGLIFALMGKRFSNISWLLFILIFITGYIQLMYRGYTFHDLISSVFWQSHFGMILANKLFLFALVLMISGLHDFWLGPKAALLMERSPDSNITLRYRKATSWFGRLNFIFGLFILYFAISLVRG